jgi:hypothetical protein
MGSLGLIGSLQSNDFLFEVLALGLESSDSVDEGLDGGLYLFFN